VQSAPALQLNFLQHVLIRDFPSLTRYLAGFTVYPPASQQCVFTFLKQHAGKSEGRIMKEEGESLVRWHSTRFNLNI
jgi:hypothetical protein